MSEIFVARVTQSFPQVSHVKSLFDDRSATLPEPLPVGTIVRVEDADWFLEAPADSARASVFAVAERLRTPLYHDATDIAYAESLGHEVEADPAIEDFSDLPFVTIDNVDSRDLDQALYIEANDGGFVIWYALADASYYVRPDSPLLAAALQRGASFYFPGFAAPMLPPSLSEGLISLNPNVRRRSLVFRVQLDEDGRVLKSRIHRAFVRSRAKLAYDQVQSWFEGEVWPEAPWVESLQNLAEVGNRRIELAKDRHVIEFQRYEPRVSFSNDSMRFVVDVRRRNDVEKWNEQLSVLCNTEGAQILEEAGRDCDDLHAIFRVHLPPLKERLRELETTLNDLADLAGLDNSWRWQRGESLADYLAGLPDTVELARLRRAVERQVRWVNRASNFSERGGPHFALGVDHYARFTAPMREIVGIFTHKEALEGLGFVEPEPREEDEILRAKIIDAANASNALQKRIDKEVGLLAIRQFLNDDLELDLENRPKRRGTVVGVSATRLYIVLDAFPIDIKLYREDLNAAKGTTFETRPGAWFAKDGRTVTLGDAIHLVTRAWDDERRRYAFDIDELGDD